MSARITEHMYLSLNRAHAAMVNRAEKAERQRDAIAQGLRDVFALMDEQWLVRNTEHDAEPGFAMRQLEPTMKLAKARKALDGATSTEAA